MPHTVIVDFAVALLITSVACDLLARLAQEGDLEIVATWTLLFGTLAAFFAVLSGYVAYSSAAPEGEAAQVVLRHRNLGVTTLACFLPVAAWRLLRRGRAPQRGAPLYWALTLAGTVALVLTAWLGGKAVFRYGVGVAVPPG